MKTVSTKLTEARATVEVAPLTSNLAIIRKDPDVLAAEKQTPAIRVKIDTLKVVDQPSSEAMTDLLAQCIRAFKSTEVIRKRFVDPLNEHVKFINSFFKRITGPAQEAEEIGRTKLNTYLREEKRKADEKARVEAAAYEKKFTQVEKVSERKGTVFIPPPEPEAVSYQSGVQTESAAASTRMVPKFRVTGSVIQVDPAYLILDETKVKKVLKAGVREIAGLTIWEEPEVAIYT